MTKTRREYTIEDKKRTFLMQQAYSVLFSATNKLQVEGDAALSGLTSRQLMVIIAILHLPEGETTLINISKKLGTTKQSTSQLIAALEKKGIVVTRKSIKDKRSINICINESAYPLIQQCGVEGNAFFDRLFNEFTTEEIQTLWILLKKLYCFDGEQHDGFEDDIHIN